MEKISLNLASRTPPPPYSSPTSTAPRPSPSPSIISTHEDAEKPPSGFKKLKSKVKKGLSRVKIALTPSPRKAKTEMPAAPFATPSKPPPPPPLIVSPPHSPAIVLTPFENHQPPGPVQAPAPAESEGFYAWLEKWMMTIISKFENLRSALWKFIQAIFGQESS